MNLSNLHLSLSFYFWFWVVSGTSLLDTSSSLRTNTVLVKQVVPVPWMLVLPFLNEFFLGDVKDEPLSGLVWNPGPTRGGTSSVLQIKLLAFLVHFSTGSQHTLCGVLDLFTVLDSSELHSFFCSSCALMILNQLRILALRVSLMWQAST